MLRKPKSEPAWTINPYLPSLFFPLPPAIDDCRAILPFALGNQPAPTFTTALDTPSLPLHRPLIPYPRSSHYEWEREDPSISSVLVLPGPQRQSGDTVFEGSREPEAGFRLQRAASTSTR